MNVYQSCCKEQYIFVMMCIMKMVMTIRTKTSTIKHSCTLQCATHCVMTARDSQEGAAKEANECCGCLPMISSSFSTSSIGEDDVSSRLPPWTPLLTDRMY